MSQRLTLYTRSGCSLCDAMQWELAALGGDFTIDLVDVDSEERLQQMWGSKVPVLTTDDGEEICHYFLDRQALDAYFSTL